MGVREDLLAAARELSRRNASPFSPADLIAEARTRGCTYPESTLRTFIGGPMCANSPDNHAVAYDDLWRVTRGQYVLNDKARATAESPSIVLPAADLTDMTAISRSRTDPRQVDIESNLMEYVGDINPTSRYASFDYCFNYFQSYRQRGAVKQFASSANMQTSCLQLGFYLASWGMLRGSTTLFQRSMKHFEPVITILAEAPSEIWRVDAES